MEYHGAEFQLTATSEFLTGNWGWEEVAVQVADLQVFNHAVSAKKFRIIQMFLELGYNVFLSDIDIAVLRVLHCICSFSGVKYSMPLISQHWAGNQALLYCIRDL